MKIRAAAFALVALVVLAAPAAPAEATPPAQSARLFDGSRDNVVLRAFVPSDDQPQGEVQLVRRSGAVVMQTVLHTRFLKRVVAEIRKKELASWPRGRAGREDALKYIDAVLEAGNRIQARAGKRTGGDRRQSMLIEFILSGKASIVAISEPKLEDPNGRMRIVSRRPITVLELSRTYVRGDIYEIAWDALKLGRNESREILEPLFPPESGQDAASSGEEGEEGAQR